LSLRRTHLYEYHREHGKIIEFAGFEMPVWYEGVIPEHQAVRNSVGLFDVTHMGRSLVEGRGAEEFLDHMLTGDVSSLEPMKGLYSVMCNERGGIVDDLITYRLAEDRFLLVYNASNREKDLRWLERHSRGFDVSIRDVSDEVAMFSLQGPRAEETFKKLCGEEVSALERFQISNFRIQGLEAMAARTGYTGEDGFEIFILDTPLGDPWKAVRAWEALLGAGEEFGIKPCGLGARDSLRLEAGLCLYGNDIDEDTNPFEARLRWVVKLKKGRDFIGKEALMRIAEEGVRRTRVGIALEEKGIPRRGYEIWNQEVIGTVTSGGYSPTLDRGIAMGYVPPEYSKLETPVRIKIRDRLLRGKIVKFHPFYDESRYGWRRDKG
jgi:aminomethyltransferase